MIYDYTKNIGCRLSKLCTDSCKLNHHLHTAIQLYKKHCRQTEHIQAAAASLSGSDEPGRAELCGAVEGLLRAVAGAVALVLPPEHLPDVPEGLVDGGAVAGTRLPHEELPAGACSVKVLELHGHVVERLLRQRLVVVVCPERTEVAEPLARRQRRPPNLLLKQVVLVQHQHEWRVAEAWLPA